MKSSKTNGAEPYPRAEAAQAGIPTDPEELYQECANQDCPESEDKLHS